MTRQTILENTPPEFRLMLLCAGKEMSEPRIMEAKRILSEGIDWDVFINYLDKHRLIPIAYENLRLNVGEATNKRGLKKLEILRKRQMARSMKIASEWVFVNTLTETKSLRVLQLKGPALSLEIYKDIDSRISKDLDLLVDRTDLDRADRFLLESGYKRLIPSIEMTPKQEAVWLQSNHHYSYIGAKNVSIELHFRFDSLLDQTPFDQFWEHRRIESFGGANYSLLPAEEAILYYVYHGAKHGWNRLRWLVDVFELLQGDSYDAERLILLARERRITHVLAQAVILCGRLLHAKLPETLCAEAEKDEAGLKLAKMALPIILAPDGGEKSLSVKKYIFLLQRGFSNKKRYVLKLFQPLEGDFRSVSVGDKAFFVYYLVRILNWVKRRLPGNKDTKNINHLEG